MYLLPVLGVGGRVKEKVVKKHKNILQIVKTHRRPWLINIYQKHHLSLKF